MYNVLYICIFKLTFTWKHTMSSHPCTLAILPSWDLKKSVFTHQMQVSGSLRVRTLTNPMLG